MGNSLTATDETTNGAQRHEQVCYQGRCGEFIDESGIYSHLLTYGRNQRPTLLIGETGVGKTLLVRQATRALGLQLIQKLGGKFPVTKLVGHYQMRAQGNATVTEFEEGPLVRAMKHPAAAFYLDEIDNLLDDIHDLLHQLLDDRRSLSLADVGLLSPGASEFIHAAPKFWFVASCVDKSRLPEDFVDRFRVIHVARLSPEAQLKKLAHDFDLPADDLERLVRIGELTRKIGWQKPVSFRQILNAAQDVADGIGVDEAIDHNLVNPNADQPLDRVALRNAMEREGLGSTRILADALVPEDQRPTPVFNLDDLDALDEDEVPRDVDADTDNADTDDEQRDE